MIRTSIVSALFACALLSACGGGQDPSLTQVPRTDTATEDTTSGSDSAAPPVSTTADNVAWARAATLSQADVEQDRVGETTADTPLSLAPKAVTAPAAPIYRFFNNQTGAHLLTKSVTERDTILNTLPQYRYEGPVFAAWQSTDTGLAPVYRFSNTRTGTHVFTISETERNHIQATMPWMTLEGAAYFAARTALPGTTALYRFYHLQRGFHFYTASVTERDHLIANLAGTFRYEGVAYYVNASLGSYVKALAHFVGGGASANSDGLGSAASFFTLRGMSFDQHGNLYAVDRYWEDGYYQFNQIRKISPTGWVTHFAGDIYNTDRARGSHLGYTNGTGRQITFDLLFSVTVKNDGNIYFGDGRTIRYINPSATSFDIAGDKTASGYANGQGPLARFDGVRGVALDRTGNIFAADYYNNVIRMITPTGNVSTFAGTQSKPNILGNFADGPREYARFNGPNQIAIDSDDNLYITDEYNHRVRKITPAGVATTIAGNGSYGIQDGTGTSARFDHPYAIAIDKNTNNLYVSDLVGCTVRKITPTGQVTTVIGVPYNCANSAASKVTLGSLPGRLGRVGGLAITAGRLYIASGNSIYWTELP